MTEYLPYIGAAVCVVAVLRCAARQRHGVRSVLAGAVCGLGALALLGLLEPVTGITLPLTRFTAFCAGVLGLPGVTALLVLRLFL
ncbi:pro-sigmaK processing inhibitor BofA family protein [Gemmiger sp.]